jgi:vacuolar-type H+-ATPase subunit C/Vma6
MGSAFSIFPYLKTKAHAILSYSPTEQQVKTMITARSLDELRSILTSTFAGDAAKLLIEEKNPLLKFETDLRQSFSKMLKSMVNISSGSMSSVLESFEIMLIGYNLKRIFKSIILKQDKEAVLSGLVSTSYHSLDQLEELLQFERPDILLDYVPHHKLRHSLSVAINESSSDHERIFKIDNEIDKFVYIERHKVDQDTSNEIDFVNILITCRTIDLKFSPSLHLISVPSHLMSLLERASNFRSSNEVLNFLSNNSSHFEPFIKKALSEDPKNPLRHFDISYRRHLLKRDRAFFATNFSDDRTIIKFLNLRWTEINDIVRIAVGKANDIDPNIISDSLITYHRYIQR